VVAEPVTASGTYFSVGTMKLSLMAIATFGVYGIYWFYRSWKAIRERDHLDISPFWRAIFAPLWTVSLGRRFKADALERHIVIRLPVVTLGILYLLLALLWCLPGPYWLMWFLSFILLVPFDRAARRLNGSGSLAKPIAGPFSVWYVAVLVVGIALLISLIGRFLYIGG
jgi:hypothetical protein